MNLPSIMGYSMIMCDEIIEVQETNVNGKNITCKTQNFYILFAFLLITISNINRCWPLQLSDKILSKTKISIAILRRKIK